MLNERLLQSTYQTVIFLHMPKTAGTTFRAVLRRQYPADGFYHYYTTPNPEAPARFDALSPAQKRRYRLIAGHVHYGFHQQLEQTCVYITFLRDPVERVISHYHFVRDTPQAPGHAAVSQMSLEDFVERWPGGNNVQAKMLAGYDQTDMFCPPDVVPQAIANLERHFLCVGLSERFDESLIMMKRTLGWRQPFYIRRNIARGQPTTHKHASLPDTTRQRIIDHNQHDIALYEYVRQRFDESLAQPALNLKREINHFQQINQLIGLPYTVTRAIRQRLRQ
jgi:hypothetical protein